jgi:hypothetical protein
MLFEFLILVAVLLFLTSTAGKLFLQGLLGLIFNTWTLVILAVLISASFR